MNTQAQLPGPRLLSPKEATEILSDSLKSEYNLKDPLYKIYAYSDKSGNYLEIFNEQKGLYTLGRNDTAISKTIALNLKMEEGRMSKNWILETEVLPDFVVGVQDIHFLYDLFEFRDMDGDSVVEPIVVDQTLTATTITIIYKGQDISIEHQFKGSDFNTLIIDKTFYSLPPIITSELRNKLQLLAFSTKNELPKGWQKGMKKQKISIRERKTSR